MDESIGNETRLLLGRHKHLIMNHPKGNPKSSVFVGTSLLLASLAPGQYVATLLQPSAMSYTQANGISGSSVVGKTIGMVSNQAVLWNGSGGSFVDLHPPEFLSSEMHGVSGSSQVGEGTPRGGSGLPQALLWNGSAAGVVNLNPPGFLTSCATGVSGDLQVGWGLNSSAREHGLVWQGTAASFADLNLAGSGTSRCLGVSGDSVVGAGSGTATGGEYHALLWRRRDARAGFDSFIDLNPAGFFGSKARGVSGISQVGSGAGPATDRRTHALLWKGSASSCVDLNPPGFTQTDAVAVSGDIQVGNGEGEATGGARHAILWRGTAASYVDLHASLSLLPMELVTSEATGVNERGEVVGFGVDREMRRYALKWSPPPPALVPESENEAVGYIGDWIENGGWKVKVHSVTSARSPFGRGGGFEVKLEFVNLKDKPMNFGASGLKLMQVYDENGLAVDYSRSSFPDLYKATAPGAGHTATIKFGLGAGDTRALGRASKLVLLFGQSGKNRFKNIRVVLNRG